MLPLPLLQSRNFLKLLYKNEKYELIGEVPILGKRVKIWFLTIDFYVCEHEPKVQKVKGLHIIGWHIPKDKNIFEKIEKTGWNGPYGKYIPMTNPVTHINTQDSNYFKNWSKRKQAYRNEWLKKIESKEFLVEESNLDLFLEHYLKSNLPRRVKKYNEQQMKDIFDIYKEDTLFYLIKDLKLDKIIAGVCILHDRDIKQLIKEYSFTDKTYKCVGVGMIDLCVSYARKIGLQFVNLTLINTYGHKSKRWDGFTKFKLEFNPVVTYFRQSYFKIVFNR